MKLYWAALVIAIAFAGSMAIVLHVYGAHSTPGIWMAVGGFPGTIVGVWFGIWAGRSDFVFFVVTALVNSAFYFVVARGMVRLKSKFSKSIVRP